MKLSRKVTVMISPEDLQSALIEDEGPATFNNPRSGDIETSSASTSTPELPAAQIDLWKQQYGQLFRVDVADKSYYIVPLLHQGWKELRQWAEKNQRSPYYYEFHERIVEQCLLHPLPDPRLGGWNASPAGLIESLSNAIQDASLFTVPGYSDPYRIQITPLSEPVVATVPTKEELDSIRINTVLPTALVTVGNYTRVVRGLTRAEVRDIAENNEGPDIQDAAVMRALIWPSKASLDFDKEPGGLSMAVFQSIDDLSLNPFARIFGGQVQQARVTAL
jgi:hypothetical protein